MWAVSGWALATWVKVTLLLTLGVLVAWLALTPGWFWLVAALAVLADLYVVRQLAREWADEARITCWWWAS
jgi:hypothetical protein